MGFLALLTCVSITVCQVAASLFTETSVISVVFMFSPLQKVPRWTSFCPRLICILNGVGLFPRDKFERVTRLG